MKDQTEDLNAKTPPKLVVNYDLYDHYLENCDLSEEEKREFIDSVWSIICDLVSVGFHVHPIQQALENCGQAFNDATQHEIDMLKQENTQEGPTNE